MNFQAGNVRGDMFYGEEHFFCSVPVLEHQCQKLGERLVFVEGSHVCHLRITCNVSLFSISTSRI